MTLQELVEELQMRGVILKVNGDRLLFHPVNAMTTDLRVALRMHKAELVEMLERIQGTAPIPAGWLLRPCPNCGSHEFWRSIYGLLICETCHPPACPELVSRRIATYDQGKEGK